MLEVYFTLVKYKEMKLKDIPDTLREEVKRMLNEAGVIDYE